MLPGGGAKGSRATHGEQTLTHVCSLFARPEEDFHTHTNGLGGLRNRGGAHPNSLRAQKHDMGEK